MGHRGVNASPGGGRRLGKECFTTVQRHFLLSFHSPECAAHKLAALEVEEVVLAEVVRLPIMADTK